MNEKTPNKTSGIVDYKELTYYRPSEKLTGKGGTANQKVTRGKFRKKINENETTEMAKVQNTDSDSFEDRDLSHKKKTLNLKQKFLVCLQELQNRILKKL